MGPFINDVLQRGEARGDKVKCDNVAMTGTKGSKKVQINVTSFMNGPVRQLV